MRNTVGAMTDPPKQVPLQTTGATQWSDYALDKFAAPEMSSFTSTTIPEVSEYATNREWWVRHFFLSSILRGTPPAPYRQYMMNFLRRTELAFQEYDLARERTLQHLESPHGQGIGHYMAAIGHWEVFLGQAWHAVLLLSYIGGLNGQGIYKSGEGTIEERMNFLYNRSKHAEKSITGDFYPEDSTLCLWLYNEGLKVTDGHLTFLEMHEVLGDLAKWADRVEDPVTMRERIPEDLRETVIENGQPPDQGP